jgi:YggT family protein
MAAFFEVLRYAVFGGVAAIALGAAGAAAVQRRVVNPFGRLARLIRDTTDPMLKPIERRLLRSGGNPQNAPWWLIAVAIVGGIVFLTALQWLAAQLYALFSAASRGGRGIAWLLVDWAFAILMLALVVRVIGSWFGVGGWNRWMRPFHLVTDWMLRPLRQVIPAFGPIDITPLVAWFILSLLRSAVLGIL